MAKRILEYTYINEDGVEARGTKILTSRACSMIGSSTFTGEELNKLISVKIPNGIVVIGYGAFIGCESLRKVEFPDTLKEIKSYAFYGCKRLRDMILPTSVKTVGQYAFSLGEEFEGVITLSRDTDVRNNAFYGNYDRIRYYDS